jgi:hypothetical protein
MSLEEELLPRNYSCPELSVEYGAINDILIENARIQMKYDWPIAGLVFLIDLLIVVAIFLINHYVPSSPGVDSGSLVGWVATVGAAFIFGTFGVLIKTKAVQEAAVHSLVFQLYYAAGVVVSCMIIWAISREPLCVSPWGCIFAMSWIGSQFFAYSAISSIGYAVGPAVWGGVTIVVSFTWGVVFGDPVQSTIGSAFALFVLVFGIFLAASTQSSFPKMLAKWCANLAESWQKWRKREEKEQEESRERSSSMSSIPNSMPNLKRRMLRRTGSYAYAGDDETDIAQMVQTASGRRSVMRGIGMAVVSGLFNGSMNVALRCFPDKCPALGLLNGSWGHCDALASPPMAFLPSCAIGCGVMVPVFFIAFFGIANISDLNYRFADVSFPGFLTGCFWSMGNFSAFFSTQHLGMTVGYPLTQTSIIVSGLWGIFYYKEIRGTAAVRLFFVAVAVILAGAALDGRYG